VGDDEGGRVVWNKLDVKTGMVAQRDGGTYEGCAKDVTKIGEVVERKERLGNGVIDGKVNEGGYG
jgi:hypothetical protein